MAPTTANTKAKLPTRRAFLSNSITTLNETDIAALDFDKCLLCRFRALGTETTQIPEDLSQIPEDAVFIEETVRIPCGHVFGEECIMRHFNTQLAHHERCKRCFQNRCPNCRVKLYQQNWASSDKDQPWHDWCSWSWRMRIALVVALGTAAVLFLYNLLLIGDALDFWVF